MFSLTGNPAKLTLVITKIDCRNGGIGRRARFRGVCLYGRGGSTPPFGTLIMKELQVKLCSSFSFCMYSSGLNNKITVSVITQTAIAHADCWCFSLFYGRNFSSILLFAYSHNFLPISRFWA